MLKTICDLYTMPFRLPKKGIVILNQASGFMMVDIANAFGKCGRYDDVVIVSGSDLSNYVFESPQIHIIKIAPYIQENTKTRFVSWLKAFFKMVLLCRTKLKGYELFFVSNPPLTSFIPLFCKNKYSTLIYDVYPDGLGDFASKSSFIYRIWTKNNKKFYRNAERVFTLTDSMKKTLTQYCAEEKIEVVPVWANKRIESKNIADGENLFVQQHEELKNKFVILYSGNIGLDHDIFCLVRAMDRIRNPKVALVVVGDGYNKKPLQDLAESLDVNEYCFFYPFQPVEMLPYSLSCANIGVVATKPNGRSSSIPSKAFNLMKMGKPMLCIAHPEAEITRLVKKHNMGRCFMPDEIEAIVRFIRDVLEEPSQLEEYMGNALEAAELYTYKLAERFVK